MNITSMQLMDGVTELEATLGTATPEQRAIIDNLKKQIRENAVISRSFLHLLLSYLCGSMATT